MILEPGKPPCPCRVYDANGLEWQYLTRLDTETGEGEQFIRPDDWQLDEKLWLAAITTGLPRQAVKLVTPVLVVPV